MNDRVPVRPRRADKKVRSLRNNERPLRPQKCAVTGNKPARSNLVLNQKGISKLTCSPRVSVIELRLVPENLCACSRGARLNGLTESVCRDLRRLSARLKVVNN